MRASSLPWGSYGRNREFYIAVYLNGAQRISGALVMDRELALRGSAALSLMPSSQTEVMMQKGLIDETLCENLMEICNVATWFFQDGYSRRVQMARLFEVPGDAPTQLFEMIAAAQRRTEVNLEIRGYGEGRGAVLMF